MSASLSARVIKAMSLFSGLQALTILCSVIKMKIVALWLGATGVGLFGIFQSVADTVSTLSDLGIRNRAVRDVASGSAAPSRLAVIALTVRRWSLLAGLLGAVVMAAASPLLGNWFFGSYGACWGFLALAAAMLFNALTGGEQALLQGSGRLRSLASANLWGTIAGLLVSIPLFRICGYTGVPLSIAAYALTMYICIRAYRLKAPQKPQQAVGLGAIWHEGKGFARLGLCMALAAFITATAHALFIGMLNDISSTAEVGYVQAGDTIVIRYVGLIFTAIAMEFYPRLASVRGSGRRTALFVNHESILLLLVLTPFILLFLLLREPMVRLLYKEEFLIIVPFITWGVLSSIPKAVSWCMAYSIVSRGDGKVYLLTESLDALLSVPLCLAAYSGWGLTGLGVAYIVWYILYALITGVVYYRRYRLRLSGNVWRVWMLSAALCTAGAFAADMLPLWLSAPMLSAAALAFVRPIRRLLKR